jgi:ABC-type Co2+ transport system permease subunit
MHIEPGILSSAKIAFANVAAIGMLGAYAPGLVKRPTLLLRTALAAVFFSVFMQVFHMPVGASELHFVGAMPIYLLLGFVPTLFGFALGLLLQGLLFDPQDLAHLAVNSLSLMVPLAAVHYGLGKRIAGQFTVANIVKLDFAFYAGVTLMVGFWLSMGTEPTPLANWAAFAASYLALVLVEPLVTLAIVRAARGFKDASWAQLCRDERVTAAA